MENAFDLGTVIDTGRLRLRPFDEDDVDDCLAAVQDADMQRRLSWAADYTRERARDWCTRLAHDDPGHSRVFAVEVERRLAGSIGLHRADWSSGRAELGYWIAPWARGHGYAAAAARAVAAYAFSRGLQRVEVLAAVGDLASQRTAENAGFVREGVLREAGVVAAGRVDMVLFSLLPGDLP